MAVTSSFNIYWEDFSNSHSRSRHIRWAQSLGRKRPTALTGSLREGLKCLWVGGSPDLVRDDLIYFPATKPLPSFASTVNEE